MAGHCGTAPAHMGSRLEPARVALPAVGLWDMTQQGQDGSLSSSTTHAVSLCFLQKEIQTFRKWS